ATRRAAANSNRMHGVARPSSYTRAPHKVRRFNPQLPIEQNGSGHKTRVREAAVLLAWRLPCSAARQKETSSVSSMPLPKPGVPPRTFQQLIFALQNYWSQQGCVILQPYDMEMGAGTFHTATLLRAVGPEPWSAAYVQPSRRPTDGRYGDNPFRLQHYYQFQV